MKPKAIYYIGGNGKLAQFLKIHSDYKITSRNLKDEYYLDLEKPKESPLIKNSTNSIFILGAAISSPERCEENSIDCEKINYINTSHTIELLLKNKNKVLFLSSDLIYSGNIQNSECDEDIIPISDHLYGKLKLQVEDKFKNVSDFHSIRLSYVLFENNSFYNYLSTCYSKDITPDIIDGFYRHCTNPFKIIELIEYMITNDLWPKTYNLSGAKKSRLDLYHNWCKLNDCKSTKYRLIKHVDSPLNKVPEYINFKSKYNYV